MNIIPKYELNKIGETKDIIIEEVEEKNKKDSIEEKIINSNRNLTN